MSMNTHARHCVISLSQLPPLMVASFGGCYLVKKINVLKLHSGSIIEIAMLAGDMVQEVEPVFHSELEQNAR